MPRKATKKPVENSLVRDLIPKDPDTAYMGFEPSFAVQPNDTNRTSTLTKSFSWYNRFYGRKDAKELLCQYLELTGATSNAKTMRKVDEAKLNPTLCWLARMNLRGLALSEPEKVRLDNEIATQLQEIKTPTVREISKTGGARKVVVKEITRPNVQEIMRDKARDAGGELEGLFDQFIETGCSPKHGLRPIDEVAKKNVLPQHIPMLVDSWKKKQTEFEELQTGKDSQLVAGYAHFSKLQVRNILKFIEQVLADLNGYISVKKVAKAPRKRKAVPVEKTVSKVKFLKEFKDPANKLDLVSVSPIKLHGASECYLYDTAKRKLVYMCADEYSKTFTVKGTTILGFDTAKSQVKTIRKPGEQLTAFMKLGKPAGRKFFDEIKAVGTSPNGRTNINMIILKAF